jgi:hypothetical protein
MDKVRVAVVGLGFGAEFVPIFEPRISLVEHPIISIFPFLSAAFSMISFTVRRASS